MSDSIGRYREKFETSHSLWKRSRDVSRGVHHDARDAYPFPLYVDRAQGSRKWDVDGNEFIDYTMGHGSLLLGHAHPSLVDAVKEQVLRGTHYGNEHRLAVEWAEMICDLVPAAEKVEFVSSGTEANMMIAQIARAFTGRPKIAKFARHFAGWGDDLLAGVNPPLDRPSPGRLPPAVDGALSDATVVIPCNDEKAMEEVLSGGDVAALFLEGGGARAGVVGMPPDLVKRARELTERNGTLLVIDEVVTGFRWSPGGYQATVGITPDLSALGKAVSGGVPGAAVCGRAEVMARLQTRRDDPEWNQLRRVPHPGTWNANPIAAAAGTAMLRQLSSGELQTRAAALAAQLVEGMNAEITKRGVEACVFNATSRVHIHLGECRGCDRDTCLDAQKKTDPALSEALEIHMALNGISFLRGSGGYVSAVHTEDDIQETIEGFGRVLDGLADEGHMG